MLKKIILPVVLLIFTQQQFYGTDKNIEEKEENKKNNQKFFTQNYNFWADICFKYITGLKWLLAFLDNVPFQYGNNSKKIWKCAEAYYGLSNGIGFFPSILNFGWLKIGILDSHINVINAIIKYIRIYVVIQCDFYYRLKEERLLHKKSVWFNSLKWGLFYTVITDIHLFSFNFFNCVKIKIISIGAIITSIINDLLLDDSDDWFFNFSFFKEKLSVPKKYFILSPRIEINISGINKLFSVEVV